VTALATSVSDGFRGAFQCRSMLDWPDLPAVQLDIADSVLPDTVSPLHGILVPAVVVIQLERESELMVFALTYSSISRRPARGPGLRTHFSELKVTGQK
jgi:hypothetical protein